MSYTYIYLGLAGLLLGYLSTVFVRSVFPRLGLLDFPDRYGLKRSPVPYPGGSILSVLALCGLGFISDSFFWVLPAAAVLLVLSFIDDRKPVPALIRLPMHVLVLLWVIASGIVITHVGDPIHNTNFALDGWPVLTVFFTLAWLLAVQQSMNFFDGLPGLSVGVCGIGFGTIGLLGVIRPELFFDPGHTDLTYTALYLCGLCIGAWYAYWKGYIIFGDSGSQILGFLLGVVSIASGAKIATTLLVLAIPILDAFLVLVRRIVIDKKYPWKGDSQHFHHNLAHAIGEKKAALLLLVLSCVLGVVGVTAEPQTKLIWLCGTFVCLFVVNVWAYKKRIIRDTSF
jgi:UDP-GlcNAc:undecaprenyl-phosphate GlcNAc-1-phosphate transferase